MLTNFDNRLSSWKSPKSTCVLASLDLRALAVQVRSSHATNSALLLLFLRQFHRRLRRVQAFLRTLSSLSRLQWTSSMIQSFLLLRESYELRFRFSLSCYEMFIKSSRRFIQDSNKFWSFFFAHSSIFV